jgi:CRP-like cAMP-binding protein
LSKGNLLLSALGSDLPGSWIREVRLRPGQVLGEQGEPLDTVYFLHGGVVSKLAIFQDGTEIECVLVGREGAVGAMAALGLRSGLTRDVCHTGGAASAVDAELFCSAVHNSSHMSGIVLGYCAWKMSCAIRNGACNAVHPIEQRLAKWILTCCDVLERSEISLSQEVFAKMLGAQRSSVNIILQRFRAEGLIELGRSRLTLVDRPRLIRRSCECYADLKAMELEIVSGAGDMREPGSRRPQEPRVWTVNGQIAPSVR